MSKVTTQIDIQYMATGLETIIKSFDKLDPSTLSKKAQKSMQDFTGEAKTLLDNMNAAIKKGDMTEEMAKKYEKMFDKLIGPDFTSKFKEVLKGVGGDFDIAFGEMTQRAAELSKEIQNIDSKITVEQKGFRGEGEDLAMTNAKKQEESQRILNQLKLEEEGIDKANLSRSKDGKLPTYATLVQNQERLNVALQGMSQSQKDNLANFLKTGEITEANAKNVEELTKRMEGNLKVEEVAARLKAKALVDAQLENTVIEKKNTIKDLEIQKQEKLNELKTTIDPIKIAQEEVQAGKEVDKQQQIYNQNQSASVEVLSTVTGVIEEKNRRHEDEQKKIRESTTETEKNTDATKRNNTTLAKAANQVFNYGLAFTLLRRIYRETLRTIRDLDKALTEMAIVTTMNRKEAFALADTMSNLARQTGFTTTEIAKLSTIYFRQGRSLSEVIELTTVAAKAARISGISAAESANFLTSAVNGFGLAADQALAVSDRFAALASQSASSYEELALGLSKFAAQANVAGVSIDFAMGLLAKGVETTREAPETIGTALKTVIARMRELTDLGKTFEDGMDVSRVETALRQVGIALRDENGQFRDLEKVLTEIGMAWNTYDRNQQASIAVSLAGTRQQSRLIAIMQDFDRTLELVNISQESAGATNAQQVEFMKSLEAATTQLRTAWQDFIRTIGETETIIGIVRLLTDVIDAVTAGLEFFGFAGKNATVILVGLFIAMRSLKGLKALYLALFKPFLKATAAEIAATAKATAWTWKWVAAKAALFAPYALLAGVIALFVAGLIRLSQSEERATRKLKAMSDQAEATAFEIRRKERDVNKLVTSIEKLENLKYMTSEQASELENLKEKLLELASDEIAGKFLKGDITWQEVLASLAEERGKNLAKRILDSQDIINETIEKFAIATLFTSDEETGNPFNEVTIFLNPPTESELQILRSTMINLYRASFGEISEEADKMLRDIMRSTTLSTIEILELQGDPQAFVQKRFGPLLEGFESINKALEKETESYQEVIENFTKAISKLPSDIQPEFLEFLEREFAELFALAKEGSEFVNTLERLNLTSTKDVQDGFRLFGDQFSTLTKNILEFADSLEGFSEDEAIRYAFARASQETDDLTARAWLLNQAFQQTTLEIAQNLDKLQSRIKRVSDVQQKWIEGTIEAQEIFKFFDENSDIFRSLDDLDAFFSGQSMGTKTLSALLEQQQSILTELRFNWELYYTATDDATRNAALSQIAILGALSSQGRSLTALTQQQQNYNAAIEAYNFLSSIGADTTEAATLILENQGQAIATTTSRMQRSLVGIQNDFTEMASSVEDLGDNLFDYFTLVGNRLVPNSEMMVGLGEDALLLLFSASELYQKTMDDALETFLSAREESLKVEKDILDKQKKVYQDYFAALDRLENQRERKRSREDLVSQLQRLEGATDERSRARALELRRELNQLDEQQAQDAQTQARDALIQGLENSYIEIENSWAQAAENFITELANSGTNSGNAFVNAVNQAGLFSNVDLIGTAVEPEEFASFIGSLSERFGTEFETAPPGPVVPDVVPTPEPTQSGGLSQLERDGMLRGLEEEFYERRQSQRTFKSLNAAKDRELARQDAEAALRRMGFAKGGMVDFEGLAMLHGSKSAPEAVLNPMQTEMFMGLRDALEKVSFNPNGSTDSVKIENISISTGSMNSNQDFKRAGETLAEAFRGAIQRKGITLNTNKV